MNVASPEAFQNITPAELVALVPRPRIIDVREPDEFTGLPMRTAVATSLLVIAMNSFAGFAGALSHATIPWTLALAITGASVLGSFGGTALAGRVKPQALRAGFAWFVLGMAVWMSFKQLPDYVGARFGLSPSSALPSRPQ